MQDVQHSPAATYGGGIALVESRSIREQHIRRVEVLDKVKALTMLSDDLHATTEMVASYFEVPLKAIESAVFDNRAEVESDGYTVATGFRLASLKEACGIQSRARSLALFPRRAILRLGMLLRDSAVAVAVRDHLLDVERAPALDLTTSDGMLAHLTQMLELAKEKKALEALTVRQSLELQAAAPKVAYVDQFADGRGDGTTIGMFGAQIGITEPKLRDFLREQKVLRRRTVADYIGRDSKRRVEYEWSARVGYYDWFKTRDQLTAPRMHNGQLRTTLYVTPVGKLGIARLIETAGGVR